MNNIIGNKQGHIIFFLFVIFTLASITVQPQNKWLNFTSSNDVRDVVFKDGCAWAATKGGLMRIDLENQQFFLLNASNSGLPSNNLSCLYIDPDSVMWIGTNGQGMARFDGNEWNTFGKDQNGLKNDRISSFYSDKSGVLWIGTGWGINRYYNGRIHSDWDIQGSIYDIMLDNDGVLWIGTSGLLKKIKDCKILPFKGQSTKPTSLYNVRNFVRGGDEDVWMLSRDGIFVFHNRKYSHYYPPISDLRKGSPVSLAIDKASNIWLGFNDGVVRIKDNQPETFDSDINRPRGRVNKIKLDPDGRVWACTSKGLFVYDTVWTFIKTSTSFITSTGSIKIISDSKRNIWMKNGAMLIYYGKDTAIYFSKGEVAPGADSFAEDKYGNLWFGHWKGLTMFNGKDWKEIDTLSKIITDRDKEIFEEYKDTAWAESNYKSYLLHKNFYIEPMYSVSPMHIDHKGNLWLKADEYLIKYDRENWNVYDQFNSGIPASDISSLTSDDKNHLWIGTYKHGLYEFDGEDFISCLSAGTFKDTSIVLLKNFNDTLVVSTKKRVVFIPDGDLKAGKRGVLLTLNCYTQTIFRDSRGNSWLGTQLGLTEFAPPESRALYKCDNSGLAADDVLSITEDFDGNLWILTSTGGINIFNENKIVNEQRIKDFFSFKGVFSPHIIR